MLERYLKEGNIEYFKTLSKDGNITKDMFKITFKEEIHYLVCTFDKNRVIKMMLVS